VTKNATPKKSVQETKSSKKLEGESPSRQSSRIAVKLSQMGTESVLTEVRVCLYYYRHCSHCPHSAAFAFVACFLSLSIKMYGEVASGMTLSKMFVVIRSNMDCLGILTNDADIMHQ